MPPGTPVALFVLGHDLRLIQGFTTDYAVLERVLSLRKSPTVQRTDSDSVQFGPNDTTDASAEADFDSALKVLDSMTKKAGVEETLAGFEELAHFLNAIPGRKSLIWFSGAFPLAIGDPTAIGDFQDFSGEIQEADNLLSSSRVSVYPVDARGIMTLPTARENAVSMRGTVSQGVHNDIDVPTGWSNQHRTMNEIANETGGRAYYDTNALGQSASQVIADSSKYYTLTYIPANPRHDGGFRKIEVKLKEEHYDLGIPPRLLWRSSKWASCRKPEHNGRVDDAWRTADFGDYVRSPSFEGPRNESVGLGTAQRRSQANTIRWTSQLIPITFRFLLCQMVTDRSRSKLRRRSSASMESS